MKTPTLPDHLTANQWTDASAALPASVWASIASRGSLTQQLQQLPNACVQHQLLSAGWALPEEDERQKLALKTEELAWVREMHWQCQQQNWIYARAVIPKAHLNEKTNSLMDIGARSLGDYLFKDPNLSRSEFEFAYFLAKHPYYVAAQIDHSEAPTGIWARRSIFYYYATPLLVSEFFLPAFFNHVLQDALTASTETNTV